MNELMVVNDFDTMQRVSLALYKSGYFSDVKSEAQAIVKVMAGGELGLPPFASMTGIHIIQGKPVLGSNVIATLVKNDPRYNYRIMSHNDKVCSIAWYENGTQVGDSKFDIDEARAAGLAGKDNWKKYPSDMLFARAISRGARRFAPGIFGGSPVYTPDEMGADTDPDGYIEAVVIEHEPVKTDPENAGTTARPIVQAAPKIDIPPGDTIDEQVANMLDEELAKENAHALGADYEPEEDEEIDHLTLALEAESLKDFAEAAYHVLDGYDNEFNVVGALTQKYAAAHDLKTFVYGKTKNDHYLQWLADRKAA